MQAVSIRRQVISNIIPAIIIELMVLIYNLADTFFIAQTHDPLQIAAVSLAAPVFMVLISAGIIFMAGSMSFISRLLGAEQTERANNAASFCVWAGLVTGAVLAVVFTCFVGTILHAIGASPETFSLAESYLNIVMLSAPLIVFSMASGGIMRAENHPSAAMVGQVIGNMLNVVLDPVMILWFGWGIKGAAIATSVSIVIGALYYAGYFLLGRSSLSIHIKNFRANDGIAWGVFGIGIPSCLDPFLMSISQMVVNSLMSAYGDMAVAATGVAMRINQITGLVAMGAGQGVQPLLGFCVGAETWERYRAILNFALRFSVSMSVLIMAVCYVFTDDIVGVFLTHPEAFEYAVVFVRILLLTGITFSIFFMFVNALQAMGAGKASLILSVCRQCVIYVPMMFLLNRLLGASGIIWALPAAEVISLTQTATFYGKIIFHPKYLTHSE
ncbi:MAG: MATE family efflux transporter [Synergistaceae bacterium]|nr:MATE family efflux transporter [Synergistaceae bacterium]